MIIIGAGISGLICGAIMRNSIIFEKSETLPNNHHALMRMRTNRLADLAGIKMKEVNVQKSIWMEDREHFPSPRLTNLYSSKVIGKLKPRSIIDLNDTIRYIPEDNFIEKLAKMSKIRTGIRIKSIDPNIIRYEHVNGESVFAREDSVPVINTVAMPILAGMTNMPIKTPTMSPIFVTTGEITDCDTYCTVYFPDHKMPVYRASITGNKLIVESIKPIFLSTPEGNEVLKALGFNSNHLIINVESRMQPAGKMIEMDPDERKKFILDQTINNNIYSLGRFATWRPKVMIDDVIDDIFVIKRLIEEGNYSRAKYSQKEK